MGSFGENGENQKEERDSLNDRRFGGDGRDLRLIGLQWSSL
jgi:hypothetical protein